MGQDSNETVEDLEAGYEQLSRSDPAVALDQLTETLDALDQLDAEPAARGRVLRHAALAARSMRDLSRSQGLIDQALELAAADGDDKGIVLHNLTKSFNHMLTGQDEEAIALVSSLDGGDDQTLQTMIDVQKATILGRLGRNRDAIETLDRTVDRLGATGDGFVTMQTFKNRGMFLARDGQYERSVDDARQALTLAEELDLDFEAAFCRHNIGLAASYAGDLPEAFEHFTAAERRMRELAGSDFEAKAGHCRALLTAGLFTDAAEMADEAATACEAADHHVDGADTWLLAASAWLEAGRPDHAADRANRARRTFRDQDRPGWVAVADLILATVATRTDRNLDPTDLDEPIARLDEAGLHRDLIEARLLRAEALADQASDAAVAELEAIRPSVNRGSFDLQLAMATTEAVVLDRIGDQAAAQTAANAGYQLLADHQALLGASDLRAGVRQHGERLGRFGLERSVSRGDAEEALVWMDRMDVASATPRPVRPPRDAALGRALAQLRALDSDDESRRQLEADIQALARSARATGQSMEPLAPDALRSALGSQTAVCIARVHDEFVAVVLSGDETRLVALGPTDRAERLARSIRADLRRRAVDPNRAKTSRILETMSRFDQLLAPLEIGRRPVTISPPAELFSVPWASLPSRIGAPTSVTTSLTSWAAATQPGRPETRAFVAGPNLALAEAEIDELATGSARPGDSAGPSHSTGHRTPVRRLAGEEATVAATLAAMDGAGVVHIAAHGTTRPDNPLFSGLQLTDGDLNVYEIDDLDHPPGLVVLSACHLGLSVDQPGRQLLGVVTGLLSVGTSAVLASSLPVPDDRSTVSMMTEFHQHLQRGQGPAAAWAAVQQACADRDDQEGLIDTATFSLFGRG